MLAHHIIGLYCGQFSLSKFVLYASKTRVSCRTLSHQVHTSIAFVDAWLIHFSWTIRTLVEFLLSHKTCVWFPRIPTIRSRLDETHSTVEERGEKGLNLDDVSSFYGITFVELNYSLQVTIRSSEVPRWDSRPMESILEVEGEAKRDVFRVQLWVRLAHKNVASAFLRSRDHAAAASLLFAFQVLNHSEIAFDSNRAEWLCAQFL